MGWTGTVEVYGNDEDDGDCDGVDTEQDCNDSDSMFKMLNSLKIENLLNIDQNFIIPKHILVLIAEFGIVHCLFEFANHAHACLICLAVLELLIHFLVFFCV